MLMLAAKLTVWDKIQAVPLTAWIQLGGAVLALLVLVRFWQQLSEVNEIVPWVVFIVFGGTSLLYWTYERNEPAMLTPVIDILAGYLPTRGGPASVPGQP